MESLSSYARQFLGRLKKPDCDFIKGIPPAIAIEQKVTNRNQRSTVGTTTEVYDYLRMLFARAGKTYSPVSGEEVKSDTVNDVVNYVMGLGEGEKFTIECPLTVPHGRTLAQQLEIERMQGLSRITHNGDVLEISDISPEIAASLDPENNNLLID